MADIVADDVKLYQSEDQTDTDTGGGLMSPNLIVSDVLNNLFPNISRVDRLQGRIQLRKIFQAITSANTGVYSGAHMIIRDIPIDGNVSFLLFPATAYADLRPQILDYIESYYEKSTPTGNAGLEYPVETGDMQLIFLVRDYEYMPVYDKDGKLVYTKKVDAKYALNITVGDLLILDDGAGTTEYIQISRIEHITENLDSADVKHYWTQEFVIVTLADKLINGFPAGTIPYRTVKSLSWQAFGACILGQAAASGDVALNMASTKARLAPVIYQDIQMSDQSFFGPPAITDNVSLSVDGIPLSIGQTEQPQISEALQAVGAKTTYTYVLKNGPLQTSTLEIWYVANAGWHVVTEAAGALSGDGSGSVADGMVSVIFNYPPDADTSIIFFYTKSVGYQATENVDLSNSNISYNIDQVSVPAEGKTVIGTLSKVPVAPGYVKVSVDQNDGNGFVDIGQDTGHGVFQGDNIEAGAIDYDTGQWSITIKSPYTVGVVLQIESVQQVIVETTASRSISGTSGSKTLNFNTVLDHGPIDPGSLSIHFTAAYNPVWYQTAYEHAALKDDGNGNIIVVNDGDISSAVNDQVGAIDYFTKTLSLAIDWNNMPIADVSFSAVYNYYQGGVFNSVALPFPFDTGKTNVIPGSLLLKFLAAGSTSPYYARDDGSGAIKLVSAVSDWVPGTVINYNPADLALKAIYMDGLWVLMIANGDQNFHQGGLWTSADGKVWTRIYTCPTYNYSQPAKPTAIAVKASGSSRVYVMCGTGDGGNHVLNMARSTDLTTWAWQNVDSYAAFVDVCYSDGIGVFLAIEAGKIFTSGDDGVTWSQQTSQITSMSVCITATLNGMSRLYVFGISSQYQYSEDGIDWTKGSASKLNGQASAAAVINVDGTPTLFVVDDLGNVVTSTDGLSWTLKTAALTAGPLSIASNDAGLIVCALSDGTIDVSSNYGESWTNQAVSGQWTIVLNQGVFFSPDAGWLLISGGNNGGSNQVLPLTMSDNVMTDTSGNVVTDIGAFDAVSGRGTITAGKAPSSIQARYLLTDYQMSSFVVFTRGAQPVHDNTFTASGRTMTGATFVLYEDPANPGNLIGDGTGTLDKKYGVAFLNFSQPIVPESIRISYQYGSIYHPQYDAINTRALPLDGMVEIIHDGDTAVLMEFARAKLTARISDADMAVDIDNGAIFPDREITVKIDDEEILGTMAADVFTVSAGGRGYNGTTAAIHEKNAVMELVSRNEEMLPILSVAGETVTTPNPIANDYKAGGAILTTAIVEGDEQAAITDYFSQQTWDGSTWEDSADYTGNPADGTYDFANHPLQLTNQGTTTERWIFEVKSLSPLTVDIRGEKLGVIATGQDATADLAPINPNTGVPYFTLPAAGWGAGWQVGNIQRINMQMAGAALWVCRVINARASETIDDYATLQVRGDVAV